MLNFNICVAITSRYTYRYLPNMKLKLLLHEMNVKVGHTNNSVLRLTLPLYECYISTERLHNNNNIAVLNATFIEGKAAQL